jgi:hypothetical protein
MNIGELAEHLRSQKFLRIFVSGPQRSGTTIVTKMLAQDLGFEEVQELPSLEAAQSLRDNVVAQCPQLTSFLHEFTAPNSAVVFMCRSFKDIIASGARIGWNGGHEMHEVKKYKERFPDYFVEGYHVSAIVQNVWLTYQMPLMQVPFFNLPYKSLKDHPLYIPKTDRKNFKSKQTRSDDM